jgi:hypothetical protein
MATWTPTLNNAEITTPQYFQPPTKRPHTLDETVQWKHQPKRAKKVLNVLSRSLQDTIANRPQLHNPEPDSIETGGRISQTSSSRNAMARLGDRRDMAAARAKHFTRSSEYIKKEPETEPTLTKVAAVPEKPWLLDIFQIFDKMVFSAIQWEQLKKVQTTMNQYISGEPGLERFDLLNALPISIVLSTKRLATLKKSQEALERERAKQVCLKQQERNGLPARPPWQAVSIWH